MTAHPPDRRHQDVPGARRRAARPSSPSTTSRLDDRARARSTASSATPAPARAPLRAPRQRARDRRRRGTHRRSTAATSRACASASCARMRLRHRHDLPAVQPVRLAHRARRTSPTRSRSPAVRRPRSRRASPSCSTSSASPTRRAATPSSSPAGRSSASASPARSRRSPRILLADEATSALDPETTQEVLALLAAREPRSSASRSSSSRTRWTSSGRSPTGSSSWRTAASSRAATCSTCSRPRSTPRTQRFVASGRRGRARRRPSCARAARAAPGPDRHVHRSATATSPQADGLRRALVARRASSSSSTAASTTSSGRAFGHLTLALTGEPDAVARRRSPPHRRSRRSSRRTSVDRLFDLLPELWAATAETLYMVSLTLRLRRHRRAVRSASRSTRRGRAASSRTGSCSAPSTCRQLLPADPVRHLPRRRAAARPAASASGHRHRVRASSRSRIASLVRDQPHRRAEPAHRAPGRDRGGPGDGREPLADPAAGCCSREALGPLILGYTFIVVALVDMTADRRRRRRRRARRVRDRLRLQAVQPVGHVGGGARHHRDRAGRAVHRQRARAPGAAPLTRRADAAVCTSSARIGACSGSVVAMLGLTRSAGRPRAAVPSSR